MGSIPTPRTMKKRKYDKSVLEEAAAQCVSVAGILRILNLRQAGGTHSLIVRRLKEYGIDTSHFKGQATNSGERHYGPRKRTWQEILVKRTSGRRTHAYLLRRALLESGVAYSCHVCNLGGSWFGKPLMLQVNHKNRDWLDDRHLNLEFICPNCHSQTSGWCGGKGLSEIASTALQNRDRRKRAGVAKRQTHPI